MRKSIRTKLFSEGPELNVTMRDGTKKAQKNKTPKPSLLVGKSFCGLCGEHYRGTQTEHFKKDCTSMRDKK